MARILIVDDSEALRIQLKKDLESHGHIITEAVDGLDGLEKFSASTNFDLIICDVNMPKMDGLSMCGKIQQKHPQNPVNLFMLTTEASPDVKARGKEVGVKAWITKPYILDKLIQAIDKITQK